MEMGCIGFLLGALMAIIFVGIGVCFGRTDEGHNTTEHGLDNDITIYVPMRYRNRGGDNRQDKFNEDEIVTVLRVLRMDYRATLTDHEKDIIEFLIDREESGDEQELHKG